MSPDDEQLAAADRLAQAANMSRAAFGVDGELLQSALIARIAPRRPHLIAAQLRDDPDAMRRAADLEAAQMGAAAHAALARLSDAAGEAARREVAYRVAAAAIALQHDVDELTVPDVIALIAWTGPSWQYLNDLADDTG